MLEEGDDLLIITAGPTAHPAMQAARALASSGLGCTVINARFIKPLDAGRLVPAIAKTKAVLTVEDSCLSGGFGSAILELCEQHNLRPAIRRLGVPDRWIPQGSIASQHLQCGLDAGSIEAAYHDLTRNSRLISIA